MHKFWYSLKSLNVNKEQISMSLLSYPILNFLKYEFCPTKREQSRSIPPMLGHVILGLIIEFALILIIIGICYQLSQFILIPIYFVSVPIILIVIIDMITSFRIIFLYELRHYFCFEIFGKQNRSQQAVSWYRFLMENTAITTYKEMIIGNCSICLESLNDNGQSLKYILCCGHIYHSQCLDQYEAFNHNNNEWGKCAVCRYEYHLEIQKIELNENYYNELPILYRDIPSWYEPVEDSFNYLLWDRILPSKIDDHHQQNQQNQIQCV